MNRTIFEQEIRISGRCWKATDDKMGKMGWIVKTDNVIDTSHIDVRNFQDMNWPEVKILTELGTMSTEESSEFDAYFFEK